MSNTLLDVPRCLNDPVPMQQILEQDLSGIDLNNWTLLDQWGLLLKRVDAALPGHDIYTQWTVLDPLLAIDRINAALA